MTEGKHDTLSTLGLMHFCRKAFDNGDYFAELQKAFNLLKNKK